MTLAGILKPTEVVSIKAGKSSVEVTIKKWPLGFFEYQRAKAFEGKDVEFDARGNVKKILSVGKFSLEDSAERLFHGVKSWGFIDETGHALEVSEDNALMIVRDYPDLAKELLGHVDRFNAPLAEGVKKN